MPELLNLAAGSLGALEKERAPWPLRGLLPLCLELLGAQLEHFKAPVTLAAAIIERKRSIWLPLVERELKHPSVLRLLSRGQEHSAARQHLRLRWDLTRLPTQNDEVDAGHARHHPPRKVAPGLGQHHHHIRALRRQPLQLQGQGAAGSSDVCDRIDAKSSDGNARRPDVLDEAGHVDRAVHQRARRVDTDGGHTGTREARVTKRRAAYVVTWAEDRAGQTKARIGRHEQIGTGARLACVGRRVVVEPLEEQVTGVQEEHPAPVRRTSLLDHRAEARDAAKGVPGAAARLHVALNARGVDEREALARWLPRKQRRRHRRPRRRGALDSVLAGRAGGAQGEHEQPERDKHGRDAERGTEKTGAREDTSPARHRTCRHGWGSGCGVGLGAQGDEAIVRGAKEKADHAVNPMSPPSQPRAPSLEQVLAIAREAHDGQTRRHGTPYVAHPMAVAELVEDLGAAVGVEAGPTGQAVALLHDVVEDSSITVDELEARFGADVARGVDLLTKRGKGPEATESYFERLARDGDDVHRLIKVCDRVHNLSELHLAPDLPKLRKTIHETLEHVVPLALSATPAVAAGLVAALHDAIRAAARAQREEIPALARAPATRASHTDGPAAPLGIYAIVADADPVHLRDLLDGGVAIVQLRAKGRTDRDVLRLAEELGAVCKAAGVPWVMNDRADIAAAAGADGVHLGQTDLPPRAARQLLGGQVLIGGSSHTEPELEALAADTAADLVAVGPVFLSPTKQGHAPEVGPAAFARRCAASRLPVVAIGGITTPARVAQCAHAGASLVASVSALQGAGARAMARRMSATFFAARAAAHARRPDPRRLAP